MAPESTDRATKAATDETNCAAAQCVECGWPFGPDLHLNMVSTPPVVECRDPWRCWERQMTISERQESLGQNTSGLL